MIKKRVFTVLLIALCSTSFSVFAQTEPEDIVMDCFAGSGTVGQVALEEKRRALLIELNPDYKALIQNRLNSV